MEMPQTGDPTVPPSTKTAPAGLFGLLDSAAQQSPSAVYLVDSDR